MKLRVSLLAVALLIPQASRAAQQPAPVDPIQATYQIGPQDQLKITVLDEPSLSQSYRVDSDGSITMDYIGRVRASGATPADLQERLRGLLANGYLRNPQVRVEVESYKSQSVMVSGEVRSPGKIPMTGSMGLLEALAVAGSPLSSASSELTIAHLKRSGAQDAEVVRVNWKDLQLGKGLDVSLQDGDLINVPKAQTFFITGQVRNSGNYILEPGTTVQQAIALAGGLTDRGSDRRIKVTRVVGGKSVEASMRLEDRVQPGDTITVDQRFF
ncbi:MAG TPA: polysaccharide biosynthesis/export family protein [Vicinamibacterales bacterium]|nr:polysaccharide biosynthesis/export family protein [Vicinamibacterales bacterium]